jgi:hypothetical protein
MIDLETLAVSPDAVILTMGAVKFDPYTNTIGEGLYLRLDVNEQAEQGRFIDPDTVDWWGQQAADVREEALGDENRVSITEFKDQLNRFLVGAGDIWAQGPTFDIVILENLYRQFGFPCNWKYYQINDSRTLFKVHGDPRERGKAGLHNALEDCISQAKGVQQVYRRVGITKQGRF